VSQVIVTKDQLSEKRAASRVQEIAIDSDSVYQRWRIVKIKPGSPLMFMFAVAALPIVAFWALLMVGFAFAIGLSTWVFKGLGKIVR